MNNKTKLWLEAHRALAMDDMVRTLGNDCDAQAVLTTLEYLCPEFIGCKPTKEQLIDHSMAMFNWTLVEVIEYLGDA